MRNNDFFYVMGNNINKKYGTNKISKDLFIQFNEFLQYYLIFLSVISL